MENTLINQFKTTISENGISNRVMLIPLLLASGNHFVNDVTAIKESLCRFFSVSVMEPILRHGHFNLLDLESVKQTIADQINEIHFKMS